MLRTTFAVAALVIGAVAQADIRIDYQLSGTDCEPEQRAIEIQGTHLRMDLGGTMGNSSAIIDGTEALVWNLDHDQHSASQLEIDADAIDFQTDVGKSMGHKVDRELGKLDAAQQDMQRQMADQCAQTGGKNCSNQPMMPNLREMMSPENMARMQAAMDQSQAGGTPIDPIQMQAMMAGAGGASGSGAMDPEMQKSMQATMQSMLGGKDMQKMQDKALAQRAKKQGVDVKVLQAEEAKAQQQSRAGAQARLTKRLEVGPDTVEGMACTRYRLELNDRVIGSECRAHWDVFKLDARDAKGSARALRIAEQFGQSFTPMIAALGGPAPQRDQLGSSIVLEQVCLKEDRETGRASVRISRSPISAERFEVPAGYRTGF
ncbi:MAG: hypothetical protein SGI99_09440 [Pseudomonadota bacterium]|nr:hypothetical protein [Pseudomonadota bacterium]